jgi:predicted Zn-ribbon and HTH transcriptional regulator
MMRMAGKKPKGIDIILTHPYNKAMTNEIELPTLKCLRCGYEWIPRQRKKPKYCARCNSPYWNKPKWKQSGPRRKVKK